MHLELEKVQRRILTTAIGALIQANHHAVFYDPGMDHWSQMGVLNATLAGELFLKAIIAKEHPLLIFRDLFQLDSSGNEDLTIEQLIERGRTYNFEHLPKLLWVATGERLPHGQSFEAIRKARNATQHFCSPEDVDLRRLALEFLYFNIDPLINKHFDLFAIEYHEDHIGYDYLVECLIRHELLFSVPKNFKIGEIDLNRALGEASKSYREEMMKRIASATTLDKE